jgi:NitT/TauT family transport system substrate-binding protein
MNKPLGGSIGRRDFMIGMGSAAGISLLGGSAFAQATKPATISEAIHLGFYIPTYVAQRKGLFKKHGFDMAIKSAGGIAQPVPALLSKAAQFAVTGTGMSVNATVEGAQMINIAKIVGYISVWVVAKPGVKFDSVDDFKGKRIATLKYPSNTFTTPTYAMKVIGGYDPEANGVKFLQLPFGAQLQAVADGRADVATVFEWDASIAETQFGLKTVFSLGDTLGPAVFTSTFVTKDYLETNPDSVQRYCNAIAEAQKLLHEDPKVFLEVSTLEFPQIDPKVIEAARARFFGKAPVVPRNPIITEQEWKTIISHEDGAGTIRKQLPFSQMVNNTFAEKAAKEFGLA